MTQYDPKKIEELQLTLLRNPRASVFAALADAYRRMGLLEEALEVTTKGIKHNPEYVSGLVAHSRILYELKDYRQAIQFLSKAHLLRPENLLALKILAHCYLKIRDHKNALKNFKRLLIHSPNDEQAISFIKKWEFLENVPVNGADSDFTYDGYDSWVKNLKDESQVVHLIDSFINYDEKDVALEIANTARMHWPESNDIKKRQDLLMSTSVDDNQEEAEDDIDGQTDSEPSHPALRYLNNKKQIYQQWLQRIEQRKSIDHR